MSPSVSLVLFLNYIYFHSSCLSLFLHSACVDWWSLVEWILIRKHHVPSHPLNTWYYGFCLKWLSFLWQHWICLCLGVRCIWVEWFGRYNCLRASLFLVPLGISITLLDRRQSPQAHVSINTLYLGDTTAMPSSAIGGTQAIRWIGQLANCLSFFWCSRPQTGGILLNQAAA